MKITDAQAHIVTRHSAERPWPYEDRTLHGWEEFSQGLLLSEMESAGVDHAVVVPTSAEGDRNDTCLAAAQAYPDRFAVVGRIDLKHPASQDLLPGWLETPGMLGLRVTFRRGESARWLDDGTADWFWPQAEAAGIPLYVHVPYLLSRVRSIAERYPALKMTIDHLGLTATVKEHEIDEIIDELVTLADLSNVAVKASSLPSVVSDPYPFASMHGRVEKVLDAFGPKRVFWGSDITRLPCSYRQAVTMFTEELAFLSGEELEWVMGRGLRTWFGWDEMRRGRKVRSGGWMGRCASRNP